MSQSALAARLAGLRLTRRVRGRPAASWPQLLAEQNAGGEGLLSTGLLIFALVSLLVAALVIYNSFRILLAQRLREVALLRCVGATRRQVLADILTESAVLGLAASVAGLGLGTAAGGVVNSGSVSLTPGTVAIVAADWHCRHGRRRAAARRGGVADGTGRRPDDARTRAPSAAGKRGSMLAVCCSAPSVSRSPRRASRTGETGLLMIAAGGTIFFLGFLAIGPLVAGPLAAGLGWLPSRLLGVRMRLAVTGARRNPSRTATTTVALTIGIGLMTLFSVVLSTAGQFATHEANRHFPADYLLSVKQGGIPSRW